MIPEPRAAFGCRSEVAALKRVLVKHARDAFASEQAIEGQWRQHDYTEPPHFSRAVAEFDRFAGLLTELGVEIEFLPTAEHTGLDSIYTRDASVVCDRGVIVCSMGKRQRRHEPAAQKTALQGVGIPIVGSISGDGLLEGGDVVWIDNETVGVGRGYRTNAEGIRQFRGYLRDSAVEVIVVPLPHWRGPGDVFHLMSMISPIDRDLALVYAPLLPIPFREALLSRSIELVEVPDQEFETLGGNVLAVRPRTCVMLEGNPITRARLENAGSGVHVFSGNEICLKGAGGPTCLTRPLQRTDD